MQTLALKWMFLFHVGVGLIQCHAAALTAEEVQQYADDLGVVLSPSEQQQIADLVKPDVIPSWRLDAEARIEQHRKADVEELLRPGIDRGRIIRVFPKV